MTDDELGKHMMKQIIDSMKELKQLDSYKEYYLCRELQETLQKVKITFTTSCIANLAHNQLQRVYFSNHLPIGNDASYICIGFQYVVGSMLMQESHEEVVMLFIAPVVLHKPTNRIGIADPAGIQLTFNVIDKFKTFEEMMSFIKENKQFANEILTPLFLNTIAYIDSGNPDLRHLRKPRRKEKQIKMGTSFDSLDFPNGVTLVGFDFKKKRIIREGEIPVSGHFRWQPCGKGRSKVELIFIEPYIKPNKQQEGV